MRPLFPWNRLRAMMTLPRRVQIIFAVLGLIAVTTAPNVEKLGDRYQVALPLLALGCEVVNGSGVEYLGRYAVMFVGLHGTKQALGNTPINHRPNGGLEGFPSGHTATATFGAASLMQSCVTGAPVAQVVVALAAAYTGGSRIETHWHTLFQVMAGAIWGILCSMALRRDTALRRGIAAGLQRISIQRRFNAVKSWLIKTANVIFAAMQPKALALLRWLKLRLNLGNRS